MKKLFLYAISLGLMFSVPGITPTATAQITVPLALAAGDTVVNTATVTKFVKRVTDGPQGIVVHVKGTKIDGTVAGRFGVYGSADGTTYDSIGSTWLATDIATNAHTFYIQGPLPEYIRVGWTGVGTMRVILNVKYRLPRLSVINSGLTGYIDPDIEDSDAIVIKSAPYVGPGLSFPKRE